VLHRPISCSLYLRGLFLTGGRGKGRRWGGKEGGKNRGRGRKSVKPGARKIASMPLMLRVGLQRVKLEGLGLHVSSKNLIPKI